MTKKIFLIWIVVLLTGYGLVKSRLDIRVHERKSTNDIRFLPSPRTASVLAFGYKPAVSDIFWIEAINYYGAELLNKNRKYTYLEEYCRIILTLDPLFKDFYDWAGTAFVYNGMPINKEGVRKSLEFVNAGIRNLDKVQRYASNLSTKGAFNFALELQDFLHSLPYFKFTARIFEQQRDLFLVGSTYALLGKDPATSVEMKLEYLGNIAFEAQSKDDLVYALKVLASSKVHDKTGEFVRAMRLKMETEEDIRKIIENRLKESAVLKGIILAPDDFTGDPRIRNVLNIDFQKTWLPTEMHVLFSM